MYIIINNFSGSIGISSVILVLGVLLVAATVGSVITETPEQLTEEDLNQMVEDVVNEITSYMQVKSILGKYYSHEGTYTIQKIIMLVTPLFHINYELSNLIVQFQTKNSVIDLYYDENPIIPNGDLFSEKNWINNNNSQYSCFITLDKDESVKQFHVLNDPTDMIYLTINLPKEMYIHKGESAKISLIMGTGIIRTISIQAPIPTSSIVEL